MLHLHSSLSFNLAAVWRPGFMRSKRNITPCLPHPQTWPSMAYEQITSQSLFPKWHITFQVWNVGSTLCDIIIAVCMTYYVSLPKFHRPLVFGERKLNLIPRSLSQLSRYDPTIRQTKVFLKKIIRLTIETGSLTGAWNSIPFFCISVTENIYPSHDWDRMFYTSILTRWSELILSSPHVYHWTSLRQFDACPN